MRVHLRFVNNEVERKIDEEGKADAGSTARLRPKEARPRWQKAPTQGAKQPMASQSANPRAFSTDGPMEGKSKMSLAWNKDRWDILEVEPLSSELLRLSGRRGTARLLKKYIVDDLVTSRGNTTMI